MGWFMSELGDYYGMDSTMGEIPVNTGTAPGPLAQKHREISEINAEIAGLISEVKDNPVLQEFSETFREAGAFGMMGMVHKIPEILPELMPLLEALQRLVEVGEKQHALTGEIIGKIEGR